MEIIDLSIKLDINVSDNDLVLYAEKSYDIALIAHERYLDFGEKDIHVWAEQGSLTLRTKVGLAITTFVNVMCHLDGIIGAAEKAYTYGSKAMTYITQESIEPYHGRIIDVKRSPGLAERITQITRDISKGKLTPEEGTKKLMKMLEKENADAETTEKLLNDFKLSAKAIYNSPTVQLYMFGEEEMGVIAPPMGNSKRLPRKQPIKGSLLGVEIWYDQRTGQRRLREYVK